MNFAKWIFALNIILITTSFAADKTINCDEPQGSRIDYFSENHANLKNEQFYMAKDRMSGLRPKIIIKNDNQVSFVIGDSVQKASQSKTGEMKVLVNNDKQLSFAGVVSDAPVLGTYYREQRVLVYSQQSVWDDENFEGVRAMMFYSRCVG